MKDFKKLNIILIIFIVLAIIFIALWLILNRSILSELIKPVEQLTNKQDDQTTLIPQETVLYTNEAFNFSLQYPETYIVTTEEEATSTDPETGEDIEQLLLTFGDQAAATNPQITLHVNPEDFESSANKIYTTIQKADGTLLVVDEATYDLINDETERYVTSSKLYDNNVYSWEMVVEKGDPAADQIFVNVLESFELELTTEAEE